MLLTSVPVILLLAVLCFVSSDALKFILPLAAITYLITRHTGDID